MQLKKTAPVRRQCTSLTVHVFFIRCIAEIHELLLLLYIVFWTLCQKALINASYCMSTWKLINASDPGKYPLRSVR